MKQKDIDEIRDRVNNEGFHYAFVHYSDFSEIKDQKFHDLRRQFLEANDRLAHYLNLPDCMRVGII